MPELPLRKRSSNNSYKLSEFIGKDKEYVLNSKYYMIYIDSIELLVNNFSLFQEIIKLNKFDYVIADDYKILEYINNNLDIDRRIRLVLTDDYEIKDRSYIDTSIFTRYDLVLPANYLFWGISVQEQNRVYYSTILDKKMPRVDLRAFITRDDFDKIVSIQRQLGNDLGGCTDLERIILISNYIQNKVQFVDYNNVSEGKKGFYYTDSNGIIVNDNVLFPQTVLFNGFGVCEGIGKATSILLSNPEININANCVRSSSHLWNIVQIDGVWYYVDNTWAITRNPNQYEDALKAKEFTSQYLLFGTDMANNMGHHVPIDYSPLISITDYDENRISTSVKKLVRKHRFTNYDEPVFSSRFIPFKS